MAAYNDDKTVIVERDSVDRSSPVGWIILLVALIAVIFFFLMGGMDMFDADSTNDTTTPTESTTTPTENSSPMDITVPEPTVTPEESNSVQTPDATQ